MKGVLETPTSEPQEKIKAHPGHAKPAVHEEPIRALVSPSGRIPVTKVNVVRPPAEKKPPNETKKREQREKDIRRCFLANAASQL
jgi:hypothetical protein